MTLSARLNAGRRLLRPLTKQDEAAVVAALSRIEVAGWLTSVPHPYGVADFRDWLATAPQNAVWAIEDAGVFVGLIALKPDGPGYWIVPEAQGRGHASAALAAVLAAHFADPEAGDLPARCFADNATSAHVLEKAGFRERGRAMQFALARGAEVEQRVFMLDRDTWAARNPLVIDTPHLRLAPLEVPRDVAPLARIGGQAVVARNTGSLLSPWPEDVVRAWVEALPWRGCPGFRLGVWRNGRLIGVVQLQRKASEIGLFLDPAEWGKGYAREALQALIASAFARFGLPSLSATVFADNAASLRLLRGLGFVETGRGEGESPARIGLHPTVLLRLDRAAGNGQDAAP